MVTNRMKGMARSVRHGVVNQRNIWTRVQKVQDVLRGEQLRKKGEKEEEEKKSFKIYLENKTCESVLVKG